MCAAGLQSASYWTPVEKLILHLSPVTRRKAVKAQGNHQPTNNNNSTFHGQLHRRGRRTHSEPSTGHGSNRASLESIPNGSITHHNEINSKSNNNNENRKSLSSSGQQKVLNNNSLNQHKDQVQKCNGHGFQSGSFLAGNSPRHHRNLLLRRRGGDQHPSTKASINSSSSNSLSSPTSGSASSENDEHQSLFSNEIQTMKCHCLFKVRENEYKRRFRL